MQDGYSMSKIRYEQSGEFSAVLFHNNWSWRFNSKRGIHHIGWFYVSNRMLNQMKYKILQQFFLCNKPIF